MISGTSPDRSILLRYARRIEIQSFSNRKVISLFLIRLSLIGKTSQKTGNNPYLERPMMAVARSALHLFLLRLSLPLTGRSRLVPRCSTTLDIEKDR